MDGIKYAVFTEKSTRLLGNNQYTSNVESGSTRSEIKHWVELFYGVMVIAMNIHRVPGKGRRMGPIMGHTRLLSQPFFMAEVFIGSPGKYVGLTETIRGFQLILSGECDGLPEQAFYLVGNIDETTMKAMNLEVESKLKK